LEKNNFEKEAKSPKKLRHYAEIKF